MSPDPCALARLRCHRAPACHEDLRDFVARCLHHLPRRWNTGAREACRVRFPDCHRLCGPGCL